MLEASLTDWSLRSLEIGKPNAYVEIKTSIINNDVMISKVYMSLMT